MSRTDVHLQPEQHGQTVGDAPLRRAYPRVHDRRAARSPCPRACPRPCCPRPTPSPAKTSTERWPSTTSSVATRWRPSPRRHPRFLDAWAELGDLGRDDVERYAYYRVGYHRGLDALRANGWRGSGYVRWADRRTGGSCGRSPVWATWPRPSASTTRPTASPRSSPSSTRDERSERTIRHVLLWCLVGSDGVATSLDAGCTNGRMTAGAVLCGGSSRRMGTDKALRRGRRRADGRAGGQGARRRRLPPVVLVGGDVTLLARLGRPTHPDEHPGEGPAGGVLTALRAVGDDVVVAACDLPLLDAGTVRSLVDAGVRHDGRRRRRRLHGSPAAGAGLVARRRCTATRRARCGRAGARSLHELVDGLGASIVPVDDVAVRNVNTPDDLSRGRDPCSVHWPGDRDRRRRAGRATAVRGRALIDVREPDEYESRPRPWRRLHPPRPRCPTTSTSSTPTARRT